MMGNYPCPCCGYIVFEFGPGSEDVCPICCWQDVTGDVIYPTERSAASDGPSLMQCQKDYIEIGVCNPRLEAGRRPSSDDVRDPDWFPITPDMVDCLPKRSTLGPESWPDEYLRRYYWKKDYFFKTQG